MIRERCGLGPSQRLESLVEEDGLMRVVPVAASPVTPIIVSSATVLELSIKQHLGKLTLLQPAITDLPALLPADGF